MENNRNGFRDEFEDVWDSVWSKVGHALDHSRSRELLYNKHGNVFDSLAGEILITVCEVVENDGKQISNGHAPVKRQPIRL